MLQQISIWEAETFYAPQDIIIVGAGFTGLWTAFHLKKKYPSKKITVIERGATPDGASLRNAGFACFGSPSEIASDIKTLGVEKTHQLISWRFEGLKIIHQFFNDSIIDYHNYGGYELFANKRGLDTLDEVNRMVRDITGVSDTFQINNTLLERFGFANVQQVVENKFEGAFHPGKLLVALMNKLQTMQVQILFGTELKQVEEQSSQITLHTTDGRYLKAQQVVLCTNAFTRSLLPDMDVVPARGQILLTAPIPNLSIKGAFHFDEGFYYFRNFNNRILLGGARNTSLETEYTLDAFTTLPIQQVLEDFLYKVILPGQKLPIEQRWAGIMAMGKEKFPIVKQINDRMFCAVRLSGMGVALAPILGRQLADKM
ncbi:MAG TPA: FAD-binding oxidoreductase [Niabella sp.]|nr:FAD-binding oxidoreductase [Niabella sp.]HOZ98116.1 FAD-binding oxidoreductase [Niabella sp.]HQW16140.1 FAD-binding oxidoreductase [Niabella sp.]HQX21352.1 FAD-binding oxidoreductase [Niabella sp.]HQX42228.1 FAD-binding oxidoreductase [Niabella sp.]